MSDWLGLPAELASVPAARRFVCSSLTALGAAAACDDAESLVCELATNAVLHARTTFTVEVSRKDKVIRVGVKDLSPKLPRVRDFGTDATTGRGMRLVASIAADWGVQRQGEGKTVWFDLAADGLSSAGAVPIHDDLTAELLLASFGDDDLLAVPPRPTGVT